MFTQSDSLWCRMPPGGGESEHAKMLPGYPFDEIGVRFSRYLLDSSTCGSHTAHNRCRGMNVTELT